MEERETVRETDVTMLLLMAFTARLKMSSPWLGEHTEFVCREILQMTEEEFNELAKAGVFE